MRGASNEGKNTHTNTNTLALYVQCMAVWCLFITFTCNCITVQTVRVVFYFPLRLVTFCLLFVCFLFATSSRYCAKLLNKPIDYSIIEFGFYFQYLICTGYALSLSFSVSVSATSTMYFKIFAGDAKACTVKFMALNVDSPMQIFAMEQSGRSMRLKSVAVVHV